MNTENNRLIAEFMNCENPQAWEDDLYSNDWNWLMEVVEKIESIKGTQIFINGISCEIMFKGRVISKHFNTKIEAVYNACIEFIKWYNNQNK